jgi:membrane-bound serine protease (ClpP class)
VGNPALLSVCLRDREFSTMRKLSLLFPFLLLLCGLALIWPGRVVSADEQPVVILRIDSAVSQGMKNYFARGIAEAERRNARAVIIELNTPGGDVGSTLDIVRVLRNAGIPVVVWVAPSGATAASAGSVITLAAHIAAMSPATTIGAASPVSGSGDDLDDTLYRKGVELLSAQMRSLTEGRPPEATDLAERMIVDAAAVSHSEALAVGLIDIVANDLDDLLRQLDGREVAVQGKPVTLRTADAPLLNLTPDVLERFQIAIVNPLIIGTLLTIGSLAIVLELRAPGGYVAGMIGVIALGLALYGLGQLPANYLGLGLIVVALLLFFLETQTPTFGLLSLVGVAALAGGLWVLFNTTEGAEWARISLQGVLSIAISAGLLFALLGIAVARVLTRRPITGKEGMIGAHGIVGSQPFEPSGNLYRGMVVVKGERWQAVSADLLQPGDPVITESLDGFTLRVKAEEKG